MTRRWLILVECGGKVTDRTIVNRHRGTVRRKHCRNYIHQDAVQKSPANICTNKTDTSAIEWKDYGSGNNPGYTMSHRSSNAQQN